MQGWKRHKLGGDSHWPLLPHQSREQRRGREQGAELNTSSARSSFLTSSHLTVHLLTSSTQLEHLSNIFTTKIEESRIKREESWMEEYLNNKRLGKIHDTNPTFFVFGR